VFRRGGLGLTISPFKSKIRLEAENAIATFQTISAIVVAIVVPVNPSMLMKTVLATTFTAALRSAGRRRHVHVRSSS
jgi:hypothetical protein